MRREGGDGPGQGWGRSREPAGWERQRRAFAGNCSAEDKYKIWMRHRYDDCVECLSELLGHDSFRVKVSCGLSLRYGSVR